MKVEATFKGYVSDTKVIKEMHLYDNVESASIRDAFNGVFESS